MIWDCKLTQIRKECVASIFIVIELCFHVHFEVMVGRWGGINLIVSCRWVVRTMANQNHRNGRGDYVGVGQ